MFNFRPDRAREITRTFVDADFDGFKRTKIVKDLKYVCMTEYDATMPNVDIAFPPERIANTLGEYVSSLGLKQLRIAETEKYAHVTFFFNGGVEEPNPGEDRLLIPSPKVATYDLQPEMSAYEVKDKVLEQIAADKYDMIILNFANADMVGHTGIIPAAVKAIETLNDCVPPIVDAVLGKGGQILLTADHGNADVMLDDSDNVVTAHSLNPVPLVHISSDPVQFKDGGKLADIAPTMLKLMGLTVPEEMTGNVLIK
jgi:2,3-bisphosphoglycerate-independent phosphoglycerate mutase